MIQIDGDGVHLLCFPGWYSSYVVNQSAGSNLACLSVAAESSLEHTNHLCGLWMLTTRVSSHAADLALAVHGRAVWVELAVFLEHLLRERHNRRKHLF